MSSIEDVRNDPTIGITVRAPGQTATFLPEPEVEDLFCPIISVDDHLLEPVDLFIRHLPRSLREAGPHVVYGDEGVPSWIIDGTPVTVGVANGAAGRPKTEWTQQPQRYDEFRPGVWDPDARVHDMNTCGVWASLGFPSIVWGFTGSAFSRFRDPDLGLACVRAYNDWVLDEWCASHPERFIPCQVAWFADPGVAADEVRRNAARGCHAISFSENPEHLGFPNLYSDHWDPFFAACEETETVINLHVGSSGAVTRPSSVSPVDVIVALFPVSGIAAATDWIFAKVPVKFPGIRIVLSEAGVSWVPMLLERLQRSHRQLETSLVWKATDPHPADLLLRNFRFASIEDPSAFRALDLIGVENVMVECDYPHQDTTWPQCQQMIRSQLSGLEPSTVRQICFGNAASLFQHPLPPDRLVTASACSEPYSSCSYR